jgi:uncharacterized protein
MNCPNCHKPLTRFTFKNVQLDDCPECGGIWFDADELRQVKASGPDAWTEIESQVAPRSPETTAPKAGYERKCPKCGVDMQPYRYMINSDVHLDECEQCGGTWVDDTELVAMSEFLQKSVKDAATTPSGQLTPDEVAKIREHLVKTSRVGAAEPRANYVADTFSFLSTQGRWRDPFRFSGWFEGD